MQLSVEQYIDIMSEECRSDSSVLLNMLIVSLISSDTILTKQDCLNSKRELLKLKEALEKVSGVKKETADSYMEFINQGIEICDRDYDRLSDGQ